MVAPVIVKLDRDYAAQVWRHLVLKGALRAEYDIDDVEGALLAAARFETPTEPEPDLFGGEQ